MTDIALNIALLTLLTGDAAFSLSSISLRFSSNFLPSILYHSRNLLLLDYTRDLTPNIVNQIRKIANAAHSTKNIAQIDSEILSGVFQISFVSIIPIRSTDEMRSSKQVSKKNLSTLCVINTLLSFSESHTKGQACPSRNQTTLMKIHRTNNIIKIDIEPKFSMKLQLP